MPKRVDHSQRRAELAAALVRRARVQGLHTVGFRDVAAEAGVSVNLVQHYFPTKEKLLQGGLVYVRARTSERLRASLATLADPQDPVARVRAIVAELLPVDEVSADLYRVHAAYAALAFTNEELAAQPHAAGPDELQPELTELLGAARVAEPAQAATTVLALATGLAAYVVSGYLPVGEAQRTLDGQLDAVLA